MTLKGPIGQVDTSPTLRSLWQQDPNGVVFSRGYGTSQWTLPTHATFFTGLYTSQHGLYRGAGKPYLSREHSTLYQYLKKEGVRTAHIASHIRLDRDHGYDRDIDHYSLHGEAFGERGRSALNEALTWLKETSGEDVFLFVHLFDAHAPYRNYPRGFRDYYKGPAPDGRDYHSEEPYKGFDHGDQFPETRSANFERHTDYYATRMPGSKLAYQLGIRDVDDMLGAFIDELKRIGQYQDTSIVFFADHGEEFFEHGSITHISLYAQNSNVPVLLKLAAHSPFVTQLGDERVRGQPFEVHTTLNRIIFDLYGLPVPDQVANANTQALSLAELLSGAQQQVFAEAYHPVSEPVMYEAMWIEDGMKLHYFSSLDSDGRWNQAREDFQLFSLDADPADLEDLYPTRKKDIEEMRERLLATVQRVTKDHVAAPSVTELRPDEIEQLNALGYVQ